MWANSKYVNKQSDKQINKEEYGHRKERMCMSRSLVHFYIGSRFIKKDGQDFVDIL